MKLVFYSGGCSQDNFELDKITLDLCKKENPRMTFIPSWSYESEYDFRNFVDQYSRHGITQFLHFPVDIPYDEILFKEAFKSDIIHLDGGNTYYFLKSLRKKGMLKLLKEFVANGGILTGLSAGAIIMTPNISTAGFPEFDRDDNDVNISNFKAMNLVKFEFFPHYRNSSRYDKDLVQHSRKINIPIYALPDGSGIIIEDHTIKFHGPAYCFFNGQKIMINSKFPLKNYSSFENDIIRI
ncbi:Type 1 glutamine amidotransferase-like domain-containing protein [Halobacteriovorax sp. HLS]|uniref:Type 1 glutamine amidotransferase-like domain-containing protein n=1 Tax=Halobacteriovorax sp. HLS TaxID=2234000 RepID=UPI000FDA269B|nr:Type 1 glutamine amidotransferase-like domain-containing protein [Halobacteriovorax sp. HLS]